MERAARNAHTGSMKVVARPYGEGRLIEEGETIASFADNALNPRSYLVMVSGLETGKVYEILLTNNDPSMVPEEGEIVSIIEDRERPGGLTLMKESAKYVWEEDIHEGDIVSLADGGQARIVSVGSDGTYIASSGGSRINISREQISGKVAKNKKALQFEDGREFRVEDERKSTEILYDAWQMWFNFPRDANTWETRMKPLVLKASEYVPSRKEFIDREISYIEAELELGNPSYVMTHLDRIIKEVGGMFASKKRLAAWESWETAQGVEVVTMQGVEIFGSLEEAQQTYPGLDPEKNTAEFTWAMSGGNGRMRFESWEVYNMLSASLKSGGRADDKGIGESDVDPKQLEMGQEVEKEHHDDCPGRENEELATEISLDHLSELPDYYDRLKRMEEEGKAQVGEVPSKKAEQERKKTRWCELCQNPAGEFDDTKWEERLRLCDRCLHEGFGMDKVMDVSASYTSKKAVLLPPEIHSIADRFRQTGVTDMHVWDGPAPGEYNLAWTDPESSVTIRLSISPNGWEFSADEVGIHHFGFEYPPLWESMEGIISSLERAWAETRDAWQSQHGNEIETVIQPEFGTVPSGKLLAGLGHVVPSIKISAELDEPLSPLHRFYQDRAIPGDPQRLILEAGVRKVHDVLANMADYVRINGIQFERIESTRYAGTDKHVDRGKLYLKLDIAAGGPIPRRAKISVVLDIKDGDVVEAVQFIDASHKHRLLNREGLKAYLNLQDKPSIMRAPDVERAQIDRTMLPPTPSKSLFHGRGGVDA